MIADAGFRGLVILARAEGSRLDGERYHADAGVPMARAATETQRAGLTGLEYGLAIPGTVGGAVWANAGAHGSDTASVLESATVLLADGTEAVLPVDELGFSYRHSRFKDANAGAISPAEIILARRVRPPGRRARRHQGAPGRHPRLAARAPAARASRPRARCSATRRVTPRGAWSTSWA